MVDENLRSGKRFERYDSQSERNHVYRVNPETGEEETLVRGALGNYWQDSGRVIRDRWGMDIDLEG